MTHTLLVVNEGGRYEWADPFRRSVEAAADRWGYTLTYKKISSDPDGPHAAFAKVWSSQVWTLAVDWDVWISPLCGPPHTLVPPGWMGAVHGMQPWKRNWTNTPNTRTGYASAFLVNNGFDFPALQSEYLCHMRRYPNKTREGLPSFNYEHALNDFIRQKNLPLYPLDWRYNAIYTNGYPPPASRDIRVLHACTHPKYEEKCRLAQEWISRCG